MKFDADNLIGWIACTIIILCAFNGCNRYYEIKNKHIENMKELKQESE